MRRSFLLCLILVTCATFAEACTAAQPARYGSTSIPIYTYRIVNVYPHDPAAYTQGLVYHKGVLYESTGRYGQSSLRKVDLTTGRVLQIRPLPAQYWGEGIAVYGDTIVQLTWQSRLGFIYKLDSLTVLSEFSYPTEGWGIAYTGKDFIMSDGTAAMYSLDAQTLKAIRQIEVHDKERPVRYLNELEYVNGELFANVWGSDSIAIIDPFDAIVTGWIDLRGLLSTQNYAGSVDVLNGIAYDAATGRLFVTGKLWPYLFEIKLIPAK
jgi:glutamine cyclotransferase